MATIKFIHRSDKLNVQGEGPLYIRIYHDGQKRQKKIDIYLDPKHWNEDKQEVRKSHPKSKTLNLDLFNWKSRVHEAIRNANPLTAKNIKYQLDGVNPLSYFEYVERIKPTLSYDYKKYIAAATNKLKKFADDVQINDISVTFLRRFEKFMQKSVSQNTASRYLSIIRTVLNRAIDDEVIEPGDSPFVKKSLSLKWEDTESTPLTPEEFNKIRKTDVGDLQLYKDLFLFSVYMDGMRLTDVLTFRSDNIAAGRAKYKMSKTKKRKEIKIVPAAQAIIDKYKGGEYLFPLLNPSVDGDDKKDEIRRLTAKIWNRLKKIGAIVGLKKHLHFHMARNTSGFIAYQNGWTLPEIQEMYRHSTIQQTRDYLGKMAPEVLDEKRDSLWDNAP